MYPHFAVIALGSNLANPVEQVRAALAELAAHPHIRLEKASSLYLTAPVGYDDQPDFVNAVCAVKLPQVRSSLVTAMILLLAQESPGAVALVVVTPLTLVSAGAASWAVGVFALGLALISVVAWLIVTRSWGQRYLRVLFGCIVLVLASMTALATLPKLGLDAWGGLLLIILVSASLAVQRWLIYPACHGAIDTRVPPWLVNWQRAQSALANALARFVVLGVAALAVEFSFRSLLMALFVFYLWVFMLVMVRMPRELRM